MLIAVNQKQLNGFGAVELPKSGMFDWVGGQNNNRNSGFHIGPNSFKAGDKIRIAEPSGRYSGEHIVLYRGADDGLQYLNDMVVIGIPRIPGTPVSGTWEMVSPPAPIIPTSAPAILAQNQSTAPQPVVYDDYTEPKTSNLGPIVVASTLLVVGIGAFILLSRNNKS